MRIKHGKYWVFAFDNDNPNGGLDDYKFSFNTIEEFEDNILSLTSGGYTGYQILDINTKFIFTGDVGTVTKWVCKNIGGEGYEENIY